MAAPILITIVIVLIVVVGGILREFVRTSNEHKRLFRSDMKDMKDRMDQLELDMADLKELVSDTIIEHA